MGSTNFLADYGSRSVCFPQVVNTFPTNEYAVPTISPDLVEVGGIHHTSLSACAEPKYATGREWYSQARIPQTHGHAAI